MWHARRRPSLLVAAFLSLAVTVAHAQIIDQQFVGAASTNSNCAVATSCASFNMQGAPSVALQLVGQASLTVTFEGTSDGQTWATVTMTNLTDGTNATTATAAGQFSISNGGLVGIRARCTSYSSGGFTITATKGAALARLWAPSFSKLFIGDGTASAPSLAFSSSTGTGFYTDTPGRLYFTSGTAARIRYDAGVQNLKSDLVFGWAPGANLNTAADATIARAGPAELLYATLVFANLGTPANGTLALCTDCAPTTRATCPGTLASCVCTSGGTGSLAVRVNTTWYCPF